MNASRKETNALMSDTQSLAGPAPHLETLSRLAATMCFAVAIGGALAELLLAWVWLSPHLVETLVAPHVGLGAAPVTADATARLIGFIVSMLPLSVLFYALHQAYELFDSFRLGNLFTASAPLRLRRIGFSMLALAVLKPLTDALLSMVLTMGNAEGQRMLVIGLGIDDYMIAVFGGLILAIGHVMVEAGRIAEDSREII